MGEDSANTGHTEARAMIDTFASVGATHFDVTWTNAAGDKTVPPRRRLADLRRALPAMLDIATAQQRNVIVRPHGPGVTFIQLDDLKADQLPPLAPAAFLTLETSPGNYQAWLALPGSEDKDFARRLRKGTGADATASGATRVAGSLNFKDKYAPDFPRVTIHAAQPGRRANRRRARTARPGRGAGSRRATASHCPRPCFRRQPHDGRAMPAAWTARRSTARKPAPTISRADFVFCMTAITWGWSVDDTAERLMEESAKAQAQRQSLCRAHRPQCRARGRTPPAAAEAAPNRLNFGRCRRVLCAIPLRQKKKKAHRATQAHLGPSHGIYCAYR